MSEFASRRGEAPVPPLAPGKRRAGAALGVVMIALALAGMLVAAMTKPAFIDSYQTDGATLWVGYAPDGDCDTVIRERATESADAVTLDIASVGLLSFMPSNASQPLCTARFELKEPLGDRELRLAGGGTVAEEWARVGR